MNKSVLITGGSRGIGRETALLFAEKGYNVAFTYLNSKEKAKNLEKEIAEKYSDVIVQSFCADVSSFEDMQTVGEKILKTFGKIDCVVANAGIAKISPILDCAEKDFDEMINTNLKGVFNTLKPLLPSMIEQKHGNIVVVSSVWGMLGASCESLYSASKAGQIGFVKSLAKELGPSNIKVNCVCPGLIETDMNSSLTETDKAEIINETPLSRVGTPKDVANAIYFLCSENASFITGQTLTIDGGWTL